MCRKAGWIKLSSKNCIQVTSYGLELLHLVTYVHKCTYIFSNSEKMGHWFEWVWGGVHASAWKEKKEGGNVLIQWEKPCEEAFHYRNKWLRSFSKANSVYPRSRLLRFEPCSFGPEVWVQLSHITASLGGTNLLRSGWNRREEGMASPLSFSTVSQSFCHTLDTEPLTHGLLEEGRDNAYTRSLVE